MDSEKLQKAIFGLHTRRFGTTAEIMIKKIINATDSDQLSFDLFDKVDSNRIEVKFSRVQKKAELKITDSNLFKALEYSLVALSILSFCSSFSALEINCFAALY